MPVRIPSIGSRAVGTVSRQFLSVQTLQTRTDYGGYEDGSWVLLEECTAGSGGAGGEADRSEGGD